MWFLQFSTGCCDLRKDAGAPNKVIAQPRVRRECRGEFEIDDDSFDTAVHWWNLALKTKGMIDRGFGILIAMSQYRAAVGQQERRYEKDHEGTFTWYGGVEGCSLRSLAPSAEERLLGSEQLLGFVCPSAAVSVDVAVFHHSFAPDDLRYAAEYIRRRWPDAVILVIGEQAKQLDDPLYDDKASSGISLD